MGDFLAQRLGGLLEGLGAWTPEPPANVADGTAPAAPTSQDIAQNVITGAIPAGFGGAGKTPGGFAGTTPAEPAIGVGPAQAARPTPPMMQPRPSGMSAASVSPMAKLPGEAQKMMGSLGTQVGNQPATFDYGSILKQAPDLLRLGGF